MVLGLASREREAGYPFFGAHNFGASKAAAEQLHPVQNLRPYPMHSMTGRVALLAFPAQFNAYDKLAPTRVFGAQTPLAVTILCTAPSGETQAASLESSVVKPAMGGAVTKSAMSAPKKKAATHQAAQSRKSSSWG